MGTVALMVEDNQSHVELMSDELETELEDWSLEVANISYGKDGMTPPM